MNDFAQIKISLQMAFFLRPFIDSLLILMASWLTLANFESFVIIKLGHLIRILKEVLLEVPQLLLNDCFALILIDFPDSRGEPLIPGPMAGL